MYPQMGMYGINPHYTLAESPYSMMTGQFTPLSSQQVPGLSSYLQPMFVDMDPYYSNQGIPIYPSFIGATSMMNPQTPLIQPSQIGQWQQSMANYPGQSMYSQPTYGYNQPSYGSYGTPQNIYSQPSYGSYGMTQSMYAQPSYGSYGMTQSMYGQPSYGSYGMTQNMYAPQSPTYNIYNIYNNMQQNCYNFAPSFPSFPPFQPCPGQGFWQNFQQGVQNGVNSLIQGMQSIVLW